MRTHKYRCWVEKDKMWAYFDLKRLARDPRIQRDVTNAEIIVESTGLLDRNGKEIYENDFLKCEDGKVREVVWYNLGAGWRLGTDDKDSYFNGLGVYIDKFEVIGNKFEHSHLLTQETVSNKE